MKKLKKQQPLKRNEVVFYTRATWAIMIGGFCIIVALVLLAKALVNHW